jgi:hypothetical protein
MVEVLRVNREPRKRALIAAAIVDSIRVEALSRACEIFSMTKPEISTGYALLIISIAGAEAKPAPDLPD